VQGEILVEEELKIEFENIWWEAVEAPGWFGVEGEIYCFFFNSNHEVDPPDDGVLTYYQKGEPFAYELSNFERVDEGYYISYYDIFLEVFVDDHGQYSVKGSQGLMNMKTDIIRCSLEL
jgi:hypothetical protein